MIFVSRSLYIFNEHMKQNVVRRHTSWCVDTPFVCRLAVCRHTPFRFVLNYFINQDVTLTVRGRILRRFPSHTIVALVKDYLMAADNEKTFREGKGDRVIGREISGDKAIMEKN